MGQRWSRGHKARGQEHKKISEAKDSSFEDRPFLGQGHRRQCSPKKEDLLKFFSRVFEKEGLKIFFSNDLKKQFFSTKNDRQNFKDSKHTAVVELKTGKFSRT